MTISENWDISIDRHESDLDQLLKRIMELEEDLKLVIKFCNECRMPFGRRLSALWEVSKVHGQIHRPVIPFFRRSAASSRRNMLS
jgi:hypothetical protein